MFSDVMTGVLARRHLDSDSMSSAVGALVDGRWTPAQGGGFLAALAGKGEAICELVGAARALRERCLAVPHRLPLVLDVCGTGGDRAGTFNVSTCVAFVVAACGVAVAKHGNRAASSRCGSADVLEFAGVSLNASPEQAAKSLETNGFAFLFAQRYHPALKTIAPIRRELGVRTIFNIVGPLANPAGATRQLIGVARPEQVELVGTALRVLGTEAAAVVHSHSGLDEIAGDGPTTVFRFTPTQTLRYEIEPANYGVHAPHSSLRGGDAAANAAALLAILGGERSPRADVVALNAALALQVADRVETLREGLELARSVLQSGAARDAFEVCRRIEAA
ncbi:MAG: anthranilate phosphoribosyltransferase [Candidatus Eremiobacteraeota bacterium]|nr:anthranilate phosphoribosyltransferase [Candidatus Eremiobacteraeota bacterium]